jgi:hypothetical protein
LRRQQVKVGDTMMRTKSKILGVAIQRKVDESPDTSWLGEYSSTATSEFSRNREARGEMGRNEFQWFNPCVENYEGCTVEQKREYTERDYQRMERLNAGDWCFIGIIAKAEVQLAGDLVQTLHSGGLWGVESDGEPENLRTIAKEQLAELSAQLVAAGFGKRAIEFAFRDVNLEP